MDQIGRMRGVYELGRMETLQERKMADETNREREREREKWYFDILLESQ